MQFIITKTNKIIKNQNLLKKKVNSKSVLKLPKKERFVNAFKKANVILKKNHDFFNLTFETRVLNLKNKLLNLEQEKKRSYWRFILALNDCAQNYFNIYEMTPEEEEKHEEQTASIVDSIEHNAIGPVNYAEIFLLTRHKEPELRTREHEIEKILNNHLLKRQIACQAKQSTLIYQCEKLAILYLLKTKLKKKELKKKNHSAFQPKRKNWKKTVLRRLKSMVFFELPEKKIKQLQSKNKQIKKNLIKNTLEKKKK